jgi:small conductance mechanosensitive channel
MEADKIIQHSAYTFAADFVARLPRIGIALCALALTWVIILFVNKALGNVLRRTRMRRALAELVVEIADAGIWVVMLFVAASIAFPSVTPANILTGLGLGSVAIGFAFRDVFENFLAGILILYREPFRLGDCIECNDVEGFVEEITVRDTHLRQTDGQRVVIPNAMLLKNQVWVRTDRDVRRTTILCRIALNEDVDVAREAIRRAVAPLPSVSKEQEVQIFAQSFGENSVEFEVTWWTGSRPIDIRRSRDEVVAAVKRGLNEAGISIAIPQRRLTFDSALAVDPSVEERRPVRAGNTIRLRGP